MCKIYCFDKLAEISKKHQLKDILEKNCNDMLNRPLSKDKILDFIKNADMCKNCIKNTTTK